MESTNRQHWSQERKEFLNLSAEPGVKERKPGGGECDKAVKTSGAALFPDVEGRLTAPAGLCATPGDAAARGLVFHVHIL